jgi:gluconokinase
MVVILMGVCGSGKTTVGELLANKMDWSYFDADDFHPEENVAKMATGVPLTDDDRFPWLHILAGEIDRWILSGENCILGCSALKEKYREILMGERPEVQLVYLKGSKELIGGRLQERVHRYMPATLLDSQFEALEEPQNALNVDIGPTPKEIVRFIHRHLEI